MIVAESLFALIVRQAQISQCKYTTYIIMTDVKVEIFKIF